MADNTQLNTGTGGDTIRDKDRAGVKTQVVGLDINPAGSEVLGTGDATNGLDVDVTRVQGTVTVAGTVTANLAAGANAVGSVIVSSAPGQAADNGVLPAVCDVVAGYDGTNVQVVKTDVNGIVQVAQNGTSTVSGTVTANAGTGPFPVSDNSGSLTVDAPVGTPVFARLSDGTAALTTTSGRLSVDASGVAVPITDNSGSLTVDNAGTFAVQIAANSSVNQAQVAGTTVDTNSGVKSAGTQRVVLATDQPQLTNALKVDGSAVTQPVSGTVTANAGSGTFATSLSTLPALTTGSAVIGNVGLAPQTSGGLTTGTLISAASTNGTSLKASAGQLFFIQATNINAAVRYLKFYNKASAPTVGTDVPVLTFAIPGNAAGAGFLVEVTNGLAFAPGSRSRSQPAHRPQTPAR
jgi:hypothetical protein